jgi:hypothetical protein
MWLEDDEKYLDKIDKDNEESLPSLNQKEVLCCDLATD